MATRRGSSKGKARGKQPARRRRSAAAGGRKRPSGARRTMTSSAAKEVRTAPQVEKVEAWVMEPADERERPSLRIAEPPGGEAGEGAADVEAAAALHDARRDAEADAEMADRQAAEQARGVEAAAGAALEELRQRTQAASRELGARREQLEAEAREREEGRSLPGAGSLGLELALGALRLVGAMVTAPVRIGLAFLRPREA